MIPAAVLARPKPKARSAMIRVLVVDDNRNEFPLLEAGFAACGVAVELATATSGTIAVAGLLLTREDEMPDFAMVDIGMPLISGFDIVQQLVEHKIPTVMISGYVSEARRMTAMAHGALDLLAKPDVLDGYAELVARTLDLVEQADIKSSDRLP